MGRSSLEESGGSVGGIQVESSGGLGGGGAHGAEVQAGDLEGRSRDNFIRFGTSEGELKVALRKRTLHHSV